MAVDNDTMSKKNFLSFTIQRSSLPVGVYIPTTVAALSLQKIPPEGDPFFHSRGLWLLLKHVFFGIEL